MAGVAAFVSYRHMSGLLTHYGEDILVATVGPLAIDGLMIMATGALLAARRTPVDSQPGQASDHRTASRQKSRQIDDRELAAAAKEIARELDLSQTPITRQRLANELRARGHSISNARAGALLRALALMQLAHGDRYTSRHERPPSNAKEAQSRYPSSSPKNRAAD